MFRQNLKKLIYLLIQMVEFKLKLILIEMGSIWLGKRRKKTKEGLFFGLLMMVFKDHFIRILYSFDSMLKMWMSIGSISFSECNMGLYQVSIQWERYIIFKISLGLYVVDLISRKKNNLYIYLVRWIAQNSTAFRTRTISIN